jgi:FkbM family methyltransferase
MDLKRLVSRLPRALLPLRQKLMVRLWWADGGDQALRFNYDLDENSVVLDLGGYDGQWAGELFWRYGCRIFVFEPVAAFAEKIRAKFEKNNRIEVLQYGLGASTRKETLHIDANASSIYGKSGDVEEIKIVDVRDWLGERKLERIHLAKLNIEGGEYELLERLIETRLIGVIDDIQVQFHDIAADSRLRMQGIRNQLRTTHEPTYQYEFVWENWTRKGNKRQEK